MHSKFFFFFFNVLLYLLNFYQSLQRKERSAKQTNQQNPPLTWSQKNVFFFFLNWCQKKEEWEPKAKSTSVSVADPGLQLDMSIKVTGTGQPTPRRTNYEAPHEGPPEQKSAGWCCATCRRRCCNLAPPAQHPVHTARCLPSLLVHEEKRVMQTRNRYLREGEDLGPALIRHSSA